MKTIRVAVGVILRENAVCIAKRQQGQHLAGFWEFPGGKFEEGESLPQALTRELSEELGITVEAATPLTVIEHRYSEKIVILDVAVVTAFSGEPEGKEGQSIKWVAQSDLSNVEFPPANREIITRLNSQY